MQRRSILRAASAAALSLMIATTPALGQRVAQHEGFWISFGFGGGLALGDALFEDDSKAGGAGFLRMGGSPSQQLIIGGELIGWGTEKDGDNIGRGALMFTALYYPSSAGGVYLKGSAGFAGRSFEREVPSTEGPATIRDETGGIGLGAGLGYDIQLGRNFFLTPALDWVFTGTEGESVAVHRGRDLALICRRRAPDRRLSLLGRGPSRRRRSDPARRAGGPRLRPSAWRR